jgi:DNA-binding MarR family transcriptional regulator
VRREAPDLSARQMAVLLTVYLRPPPHTVRGLAQTMHISKPAVSRALDRLCKLELVRRKKDEADKRNILVTRTVRGSIFLREYGEIISAAATEAESARQNPEI